MANDILEINTMIELSIADKIKKMGFDSEIFLSDILLIDTKLHFDYSKENLINNVYPYLKILKNKYKMNMPLSITGIDMIRLEHVINSKYNECIKK